MVPQSLTTYLRGQEIGPVLGNMICNPVLAWLGNRKMEGMTLFGEHSLVFDTALTSIIASLLVTLFASSAVHRDLKAGRIAIPEAMPRTRRVLGRLPQRPWTLGLIFGGGIAAVLVALILGVFYLFGMTEIPFPAFLVIKIVYTGLLGFVVAHWVILRHLTPA